MGSKWINLSFKFKKRLKQILKHQTWSVFQPCKAFNWPPNLPSFIIRGESHHNLWMKHYSEDHGYPHAVLHINRADVCNHRCIRNALTEWEDGERLRVPSASFLSQHPQLSTPSGTTLLEAWVSEREREKAGNAENGNYKSQMERSLKPMSWIRS